MFDMNLKTIKIVYFDSFMKSVYEIRILNSYTTIVGEFLQNLKSLFSANMRH